MQMFLCKTTVPCIKKCQDTFATHCQPTGETYGPSAMFITADEWREKKKRREPSSLKL